MIVTAGDETTTLRPVTDDDQDLMARWRSQPTSPFDNFEPAEPPDPRDARVSHPEGFQHLLVLDGNNVPIGSVQWHEVRHGPNQGSTAFNIGISLVGEARGRGHGSRAQALLVDYLFEHFPVARIEAGTDANNIAEQRALERAGFQHEGVARRAQWRAGSWHDVLVYSRIRPGLTEVVAQEDPM